MYWKNLVSWIILSFISEIIYLGSENPLISHRQYKVVFTCLFEFFLYPFDTQICTMKMALKTSWLVSFDANASLVEYTGESILLEYEVGKIELAVDNIDPSLAEVRFMIWSPSWRCNFAPWIKGNCPHVALLHAVSVCCKCCQQCRIAQIARAGSTPPVALKMSSREG